ncbi:MAG TPA: GNAT family N-acetyltransferase [Planctomycetaceae bacterium]|nr:GNAT family N-acetyltransferase [Planctomycetaceae bacterium]
MHVRRYRPGEERELWQLFFETVRTVNVRDYTLEQVQAWAPDEIDEQRWRSRIQQNNPYVCVYRGEIVGFADVQETGYIDHFFVHCRRQGRGVGTILFESLESDARARGLSELSSHVSITARPFFESKGFVVEAEQEVSLGNVVLRNYRMLKSLVNDRDL